MCLKIRRQNSHVKNTFEHTLLRNWVIIVPPSRAAAAGFLPISTTALRDDGDDDDDFDFECFFNRSSSAT